jgi:hypothetical protein
VSPGAFPVYLFRRRAKAVEDVFDKRQSNLSFSRIDTVSARDSFDEGGAPHFAWSSTNGWVRLCREDRGVMLSYVTRNVLR